MKKLIYICNCLLLISIVTIIYKTPIDNKSYVIKNDYSIKKLKSEIIKTDDKTEESNTEDKEQNVIVESKTTTTEETTSTNKIAKEEKTSNDQKNIIVNNNDKINEPEKKEETKNDVIETITGKMSGYGPNCSGCSGYLSSGKYVGDGNIYYNDKTYGQVRIVAGDYKYKFGSIVRIKNSNVSSTPIIAIILDRGGSIGINKKYTFDLLFESEEKAIKYDTSYNVTFEILRNGY